MRIAECVLALQIVSLLSSLARGDDNGESLSRSTHTVYLMPNEPAAKAPEDPRLIADEVERFNKYYEDRHVTVLNTTIPRLRDQLLAWNPEFAVPTWPMVKGQASASWSTDERGSGTSDATNRKKTGTLDAIAAWVRDNPGVHVNVLVVDWRRGLEDIQRALKVTGYPYAPDIAQVGDTWVEFLDDQNLVATPRQDHLKKLRWRSCSDNTFPTSLRYIQDIRLLYYWKHLPDTSPDKSGLQLEHAKTWEDILAKLKTWIRGDGPQTRRPPMVMPIGLDPNLLHGLFSMTRAGGGRFLTTEKSEGPRLELTSPSAWKIPLLLSTSSVQEPETEFAYRIIAFPEMSHQEAIGLFVDGHYSATIEPLSLLRYWRDHFEEQREAWGIPKDATFWDYAGVVVPPSTFKGGSDLIVTRRASREGMMTDQAFDLARHIAASPDSVRLLAEYGHLPAQAPDAGVAEYIRALGVPADHGARVALPIQIQSALDTGITYPALRPVKELESNDVLHAIQGIYLSIAENGNINLARDRIMHAASETEEKANIRINPGVKFWKLSVEPNVVPIVGTLVAFFGALLVLGLFAIGLLIQRNRAVRSEADALEARNRLLDSFRRVRGFTSSALTVFQELHSRLRQNVKLLPGEVLKDAERRQIIMAGIEGWRRGKQDDNWDKGPLRRVVWNAIMLTLDAQRDLPGSSMGLVQNYNSDEDPDAYLCGRGETRESSAPTLELPRFNVDVPPDIEVDLPFMLENALVCLLQNSLKASLDDSTWTYGAIEVCYDTPAHELRVTNRGGTFSTTLLKAINGSLDFETFATEVELLIVGNPTHRPGIGLVLAFEILSTCYGKPPRIVSDTSFVTISVPLR
jgi:hypothetical protein